MAPTEQQAKAARLKQLSGKQPKAKIMRYLQSTQPQLVEGPKSALLMRGVKCSDAMMTVLRDLRSMKAPHAKLLTKNNVIMAFDEDGQRSLELLTTKNDTSLFAMASHNKKRPNNLIMGRTFDHRVLDMMELGLVRYKSLQDYKGVPKKRVGSKPLLLFQGDVWHLDVRYKRLQNLLLDFYRGDVVDQIVLAGLDHIMVFSAAGGTDTSSSSSSRDVSPLIHQRTYLLQLSKSSTLHPNDMDSEATTGSRKAPVAHLVPCGPDMDFRIRRFQFADADVWKQAMKMPQQAQPPKAKKNKKTNLFGETLGRLHLERQDLDKMQGKHSKALRKASKAQQEQETAAVEEDLEQERKELAMEFKRTHGFEQDEIE